LAAARRDLHGTIGDMHGGAFGPDADRKGGAFDSRRQIGRRHLKFLSWVFFHLK